MKLHEDTELHQARLHVLRAREKLLSGGDSADVWRELDKAISRLDSVAFRRGVLRQEAPRGG